MYFEYSTYLNEIAIAILY